MRQIKKKITGQSGSKYCGLKSAALSALIASAAFLCTSPLEISATTPDDVIAYARSVGMPEEQVQYYINTYSGGSYTSEQCDKAIGILAGYYANRDEAIGGEDSGSSGTAEPVPSVAPEEFEQMEVHEKQDYITQLPKEEKQQYLDLMTNEEKNQLVKEMDAADQVEIISEMLGVDEAFGYQFAIENVSDGMIMLSARDDDGKLVGVTVLGDSVEKTGYSYFNVISVCGGVFLLSLAGVILLVRKCR